MKHKRLISILSVLLLPISSSGDEGTITLVDKSCVLSGPAENSISIKTTEGVKGASMCKPLKKGKYMCSYSPNDKNSKVSEIELNYIDINKQTIILSNEDGNIKVVIDMNKKAFYWGQTTTLIEQAIVINKYCIGYALTEKDVSEIMKKSSK